MTARDTYNSSVTAAAVTKQVTTSANELTRQEAINAIGVNVGANPQFGATAAQIVTIKAAAQARRDADFAAEQARQAAVDRAREALRATGDLGPT
jgi:hypothetical protein